MTYLLLNLLGIAVACALVFFLVAMANRKRSPQQKITWRANKRPLAISLLVLLALTAVFDNLIIASGIVAYDEQLISGIKIGIAPIEDFAYTIVAALLLPTLWLVLPRKKIGK